MSGEPTQVVRQLVDAASSEAGMCHVDVYGGQGVQVGDGNVQFNTFMSSTEPNPSFQATQPSLDRFPPGYSGPRDPYARSERPESGLFDLPEESSFQVSTPLPPAVLEFDRS
jgi:hypothetical protein